MIRREVCVCGGVIIVPANAPWDHIALAIRRHQRTALHREWRFGNEWIAYGTVAA